MPQFIVSEHKFQLYQQPERSFLASGDNVIQPFLQRPTREMRNETERSVFSVRVPISTRFCTVVASSVAPGVMPYEKKRSNPFWTENIRKLLMMLLIIIYMTTFISHPHTPSSQHSQCKVSLFEILKKAVTSHTTIFADLITL